MTPRVPAPCPAGALKAAARQLVQAPTDSRACCCRSLQTATAAAQTLAAAEPSAAAPFAVRPPGAVRPLNVSKERLSLKAQVIFESSWKKIEEKYKEVQYK